MKPSDLRASSFEKYPPEAAQWCRSQLDLLRRLPLAVAPSFLERVIELDSRFPAEKRQISTQANALSRLEPAIFEKLLAPFSSIAIPDSLADSDWVNLPGQFDESLSAHMWSTRQIDAYRTAANALLDAAVEPRSAQDDTQRIVVFIAGPELSAPAYPLFGKLRPHGLHATAVAAGEERTWALDLLARRAGAFRERYAHWYLDGGTAWDLPLSGAGGVTTISYSRLNPVRAKVLATMQQSVLAGDGPEILHHRLAALRPDECGASQVTADPILQFFAVDLLTQGSGTQIYSTSFVQWAARETLRRAHPYTTLIRVAARVRQRSMNDLIDQGTREPDTDVTGSAVDADMAAYYTWLELQKLPGAANSIFVAWFQASGEAFLAGPGVPRNAATTTSLSIGDLFAMADVTK